MENANLHKTAISELDTTAAAAGSSLAGSLSSAVGWADSRTASWVHEQSSIDGSVSSECPLSPSLAISPALDVPAPIPVPLSQWSQRSRGSTIRMSEVSRDIAGRQSVSFADMQADN
ncbi:hypothetical protein F7725_017560 [Dissostichus mawsoni]|uniref:Uncharacterized protein n=1 Tax=Dissostichus mawsoni TaxID=36200 RepID=A0A7J5Z7Z0_DISMA|nr:hypothetical protein F7725_017560 [Dissostichus mawsoni]